MERMDYNMNETVDENQVEPLLEPVLDEPEPMEGVAAITEVAAEDDKPEEDPLAGEYTWEVMNYSKLQQKTYSETFEIGGYPWRLLLFPRGNKSEFLSIYLDVADANNQPPGWQRIAFFRLILVNQLDDSQGVEKAAEHKFQHGANDWGFTQFLQLSDVRDPAKGYLINDTLVIRVKIKVQKLFLYDSKKETGFVGLKNQGATCYMNSLLQTLYNINYFRQAVYHMPTTEEDSLDKSIPLALQSLFYKMQFGDSSVSTKDLTKSFGWDSYESLMQHDVQELNRVLCEKLEEKMKSTKVENIINKLFEGHTYNFIQCVNVEYKSTRRESFMDLQLDVKGCKNIYESFDKYTEIELLDGQNQYKAEGFGLQDAKKGVLFDSFPPVLQLQLKRFEYDFQRDMMVKINDKYEFYEELDLDVEDGKYLSPNADRTVRNKYKLHSVLVHSGGVHGGHYYAFIRPGGKDWLKFDDEKVTKEEIKNALNEQYGGEDELNNPGVNNPGYNIKITKYSNAYMLVYIRESDWDYVMCDVVEEDIQEHVRDRLKAEQEEKERRRKEKQEAHLYTWIKVATDEDLREQIGNTRHFDLVEHDKVRTFRIQKQKPFTELKQQISQELGIPEDKQRYWLWARRQNSTFRPSRPLLAEEELQAVSTVKDISHYKGVVTDLKLYLETPQPLESSLHPRSKMEMLLFCKEYDPATQTLKFAGRMFAHKHTKMGGLFPFLRKMAGYPDDAMIEVYEEIKFEPKVMCEPIEEKYTLASAQLEDGDIICFQLAVPPEEEKRYRYPHVNNFLDYVRNRQIVCFKKLENPKEDGIQLELSKEMPYDDVTRCLADALELSDPRLIRLTQHNCYSQVPKPSPIKYRGHDSLQDMLSHYNQSSDVLYYEVLDIPLPELERLKTLKVVFHSAKTEEVSTHQVRLPKESMVEDVLFELKKQLGEEYADKSLRLMEVFYSRIYKVFEMKEKIDTINDQYWTVRAEAIPQDELNLTEKDRLIMVCHYNADANQHVSVTNFGDPFMMRVSEDETLAQVKARIQNKLGVNDAEFAKWKFAYITSLRPPEYLNDEDKVATKFSKNTQYVQPSETSYLGLEHVDTNPRRSHHNSNRFNHYERPVKIYN